MKTNNSQPVYKLLSPYRNIVLKLYSILIWTKPYHAPLLGGSVSALFLLIWLIDISVISKICFLAITVAILDYTLPLIDSTFQINNWTDKDEQDFDDICEKISNLYNKLTSAFSAFTSWKYTNTKLYYSTLLTSLLIIAWVGSVIHNLLLVYLITLFIVLYPGLTHYNLISQAMVAFKNIAFSKSKAKKN